jgi:hypothetical protein
MYFANNFNIINLIVDRSLKVEKVELNPSRITRASLVCFKTLLSGTAQPSMAECRCSVPHRQQDKYYVRTSVILVWEAPEECDVDRKICETRGFHTF